MIKNVSKTVTKHPGACKLLKISDIRDMALIPGTVILFSGTGGLRRGTEEVVSGYGSFESGYGGGEIA